MIKAPNDYPLVLTVNQVAGIMGIGRSKAYEMMQNPKFPVIREGRKLIIPRDAFLRWLDPDYGLGNKTLEPSVIEKGQSIKGDRVIETCTKALVEAVNNKTISLEEVITWALSARFGG